jgi:hypothetical protein
VTWRYAVIVASALAVTAPGTASAAPPTKVAVVVVKRIGFTGYTALGEFVPGAGPRVSRASALAALERGEVRSSLLGGKPKGKRLIRVSKRPAAITIYVALPPAGTHPNDTRYPIAIVGGGYRGILTSSSTRIRGLVSIADIAPTVLALEQGKKPRIRSSPDADAPGTVASLEQRIHRVRDVRWPASLLMIGVAILWGLISLGTRSEFFGRACFLTPPTALMASLVLSGAGVTKPWVVDVLLGVATLAVAPALAAVIRRPGTIAVALIAVLVACLVVLAAWPEVNAISAYGPHPDEGGRFYGVSNRVEMVLLLPALLPAGLLGLAAAGPLAVLALATVGLSSTGADGGGLVVFAAGFLALAPRLAGRKLTAPKVALAAAGALALAIAIVAIDAAFGGSSHVTHAVGGGPTRLWHDFTRRLHLSWASATSSWHQGIFFFVGLAVIGLFAARPPRTAVRDALFVALAVSLLVNDAPLDTIGYGALVTTSLWAWERLRPAGATLLD